MSDRKKPGVAFWATVLTVSMIGMPVAYALSIGPVDLILDWIGWPDPIYEIMDIAYAPLYMALDFLPERFGDLVSDWDEWCRALRD